MKSATDWLPSLVLLEEHGGDWERYLEVIYGYFAEHFIASQPSFCDQPVRLKREPFVMGKEATFWHLISEGSSGPQRLPDLRRCERIRWPRAMIEAVPSEYVKCWRTERGNDKRVVIALSDFSYIVVLADRRRYVLLWTAYCVEREHRRKKLQGECREYERARKN